MAEEGDLAVKIAQTGQLVMFPRPVLEILPSLPTLSGSLGPQDVTKNYRSSCVLDLSFL